MIEINTDILIIGGGSAGVSATFAAASTGSKVTLVEGLNYLGGIATSAEVGTICGLYKFSQSGTTEYITNGFAKDFADELSKLSETKALHNNKGLHYLPYNTEAYKKLCFELLQQQNIKILFNSTVEKVESSNQFIQSVILKTENGTVKVNCKSIIDCSGNSCISQLAKLPVITSDSYQAAAQVFTISGIPEITEDALNFLVMKELQKAIYQKHLEENFNRIYLVQGSLKNNTASFKLGIPINVTYHDSNLDTLRDTAIEIINQFVDYFSTNVDFFKNITLQGIAPKVGIRVGVRSHGKYILTEEDVLSCKKFDSAIANCSWPIEEWTQDKHVQIKYFAFDDFYQIPADCLISNTMHNLFFAGKNISATNEAIASARVMGICLQTGYAAGLLAANQSVNIPQINTIRAIQTKQFFA